MTQAYDASVAQLEESTNPIIRYKLERYVHGVDFTHAEWEKEAFGKARLFLTVDALEILNAAGRLNMKRSAAPQRER